MNRLPWLLWMLIALIFTSAAFAGENRLRIGVLAYRSLDYTRQQWQPLANYLGQTSVNRPFEIVPLHFSELDKAVSNGELDFILTNPEHYVIMRQRHELSAIATLMPLAEGHPVNQFGGVIVTRSDRLDLQTLADLAGKVIASPDRESFGGFIMQQWELYKQGVTPARYIFTGMPHDQVVERVLSGEADAGFVRSGVIEALLTEGKIHEGAVKILNRQTGLPFPQAVSTQLYPEWPFIALSTVDAGLVKQVSLALLNLDNQHPAAMAARIFGFSPPSDYSKVESLMLNLNVHPEKLKNINLLDVYYRYRQPIWGMLLLLGIIVLLVIKLLKILRHLRYSYLKYHLVADYTSDWEYWLSPAGEVVYMSPSCEDMTGYTAEAFKASPQLLQQLVHSEDQADFQQHWQNHNHHQRPGEMEFRLQHKDGRIQWIHHLCRPTFDDQGNFLGVRASNRDITQRKQIELELSLHDIALKACGEAIAITDTHAMVRWINPAYCGLTGYGEQEILGHPLIETEEQLAEQGALSNEIRLALQSGQPWRGEMMSRRKDGGYYTEQLSITPVYTNKAHASHFIVVKQDTSERKRSEEQIRQLAFYDPLTQLANRRLLVDRLEQALVNCRRHQQYGALLFLDLDKFKPLNDRYGHDLGDQLLCEVAKRLRLAVRQQDTAARLGGDEFVVLLAELNSQIEIARQDANQIAWKLHQIVAEPYILWVRHEGTSPHRMEYLLTASIGISLFLNQENNANGILKQADIAMYKAKRDGRNSVSCFN